MKLYYAPGVCSIGIHVLLEEIGKPYQLELSVCAKALKTSRLLPPSARKERFRLSSATTVRS